MDIRDIPQKSKPAGTTVPAMHPTVNPKDQNQDQSTRQQPMPDSAGPDAMDTTKGDVDAFRADLYESGVTDELLFKILDTIITAGNYTWEFKIFNKIPCTFQIRPDWVRQEVVQVLETRSPSTMAGFTDLLNRYNLAGSLVRLGDTKFTMESPEDHQEVLKHLSSFPFVTINVLITELAKFDKIIAVATSPWALENFTEPQSEK
jgi:hypothetical protein